MITSTPNRASLVRRHGFTIVELLIVVVVIAILAAVTIVAYNGIQNRAKASAAQSAAAQAAKKLATYAVTNADTYPADKAAFLTATGLTEVNGTTYQYTGAANNTGYCVTTTTNALSYFTTHASANPTAGGCPGHGVNGVAAVTNGARNPHAVTGGAPWTSQTPSGSATSFQATAAQDGGSAYQVVTSQVGQIRIGIPFTLPAVAAGDTIGVRVDVFAPVATQLQIEIGINGVFPKSSVVDVASGWNTIARTVTMPSAGSVSLVQILGVSNTIPSGSTWRASRAMIVTSSSIPQYADGTTTNWVWDGTANNATSTGPPTY